MVAAIREQRSCQESEMPPRESEGILKVHVQSRTERPTDDARRGFNGRRGAQRHAQIELDLAIAAAKQMEIKRGSQFNRGAQVGQAAAAALDAPRHLKPEPQLERAPTPLEQR